MNDALKVEGCFRSSSLVEWLTVCKVPATRFSAGHLIAAQLQLHNHQHRVLRQLPKLLPQTPQLPSCCVTLFYAGHNLILFVNFSFQFHIIHLNHSSPPNLLFALIAPRLVSEQQPAPSTRRLLAEGACTLQLTSGIRLVGTMPPPYPSSSASLNLLRHPLELRSLLPSLHNLIPRLPPPDTTPLPTRTTPISRTLASLIQRQQTTVTTTANPIIPQTYSGLGSGPQPSTVVGIVFGSVAGFLLLLWLIYTCFGIGGGPQGRSEVVEEEVIRRRSRSPPRRPRSARRTVVASSVSESEHVMEEVRSHHSHHSHHSPPPRRNSSRRETIVVEETVRRQPPPQDEFIEVIEEHDVPPPRRSRKSSGFKHIDPEAYGGGDGKFRRMSSGHR